MDSSVSSPNSSSVAKSDFEGTPHFDKIYGQIRGWVKREGPVTPVSVISFVTRLMKVVQNVVVERHQGAYKKKLVLALMTKLIKEIEMNENDRVAILAILQTVVSSAIDVVVGIATGQIDVGKIFVNCGSCCLPLKK